MYLHPPFKIRSTVATHVHDGFQKRAENNSFYQFLTQCSSGWLGWAMVLGSFQCRGVMLLLHIVGQGPAVLAAGEGRVGYIFLYFSSTVPFLCPVFWETAKHD